MVSRYFNPIIYCILRSCQARGRGGLFGPDPENRVTVNGSIWNLIPIMVRMILVNMQNFKLLSILLLEIWRHKNFLWNKCYRDSKSSKTWEKSLLCLKTSFLSIIYTSLCIYMVLKQNKKFHTVFNYSRRLISKTTAANPPPPPPSWWIDFIRILPKCV